MKQERYKLIAKNSRASFEYFFEEKWVAGLVLKGSEIKSIRERKVSINEAFGEVRDGEVYLLNCRISEYSGANRFNHDPNRLKKLLLKKQEIRKIIGKTKVKGYTLVPTMLYINEKNIAKIEIALAKGKKLHDKRQTIKERDWQRQKSQLKQEKNL